ncbi:hypothetical protein [Maridesulfovibrio ferrireducens]|uniref:hypothetical protein n=1 Tax=Maridesulfovibrio ferrireducens TaxID=246191 RepID=UPI001A20D409|nr:hypothetical protein [Maridesulfovibrio ferrireducens]MBI9110330.1 hypothetical protein [Maridesulfovibrio ferrireducens]
MSSASKPRDADDKPEYAVSEISEELKKDIAVIVAAAVTDGIIAAMQKTGTCTCNLEPEAAKEVGTLMDMVRDLGDGNHCQGVKAMRAHHGAIATMLEGRNEFWRSVARWAGPVFIAFVGMACWEWIKVKVAK